MDHRTFLVEATFRRSYFTASEFTKASEKSALARFVVILARVLTSVGVFRPPEMLNEQISVFGSISKNVKNENKL